MAAAPRAILAYGDLRIEAPPGAGLRELVEEAEAKFGLAPKSFAFFDGHGSVESPSALQRALRMASITGKEDDVCVLEVREHPEWKRMRDMDAQIQQLASAGGPWARALESRILAKVEEALACLRADVRRVDAKATMAVSLAPLIQEIAMEQIDLKESGAIAVPPLVKELALQHMDLKAKVDSLADIKPSQAEISNKVDSSFADALNTRLAEKVQAMGEDIQSLRDHTQLAQHGFKALQAEVRHLAERYTPEIHYGDWVVPSAASAAREDAAEAGLGRTRPQGSTAGKSFGRFAYSTKTQPHGGDSAFAAPGGPGATTPFAWSGAPSSQNSALLCDVPQQLRTRGRLGGCRSLPQLLPVN
mmetsp:Transcript_112728/g.318602  ORF Transcript_112728/g.318602 Transcript_112728/m.318602 type:complete len:360 (+) Transcript_112728:85-1164(+)